jgi:ATP-dependent DNA helicase RecG
LIAKRFKADIWTMHAKMAIEDRDHAMASFRDQRGAILIATTMIEVGIDVAHATMMIIFAAEQFGLSQLHQLRGRVGRGEHPSVCYLVSEKEDVTRLMLLQTINDGFELSAKDLALRGPGQFVGSRQSGFFKFRFLDFFKDGAILEEASRRVQRMLDDPLFEGSLRQAHLIKRLKRMRGSSNPYAM